MEKGLLAVVVLGMMLGVQADPRLDNTKDFILGYFTGFQGSTYNLTDTCLSPAIQSQLSTDFDNIFQGKDILSSLLHLENDVIQASEDCMLWVLPVSIIASLEDKGLDTVKDFIEHFGTIIIDLIYAIDQFNADFFESGRYFGTALGEFLEKVPVESRRKLFATLCKPNYLDGIQNFTMGLVHGLQSNTTGTSVCLNSFGTIAKSLQSMGDVAYRCVLFDMNACDTLGIAVENLLMVLVSFNTNCQLGKLWTKMAGLFTLDGWITLYKNMYWYQTQIRQDYNNLVAAYQTNQYYTEGLNIGEIIQLAFSFTVK